MKYTALILTLFLAGCGGKSDDVLIKQSEQAVSAKISSMAFQTCSQIAANPQLFKHDSMKEMCGYEIDPEKPIFIDEAKAVNDGDNQYVCSRGNGLSYTGEAVTFRSLYKDGDKAPVIVIDMPDSAVSKSVIILREVQTEQINAHCK